MYYPRLIILLLSLVLPGVKALNAAGPYEAVYFYTAYKMEFATKPAGSRTIAVGCVHDGSRANRLPAQAPPHVVETAFIAETIAAGVAGICIFDGFLKHIQTAGWNAFVPDPPRNPNPRSMLVTLNPNADEIAAKLTPDRVGGNNLNFVPDRLVSPAVVNAHGARDAARNLRLPTRVPYPYMISTASDAIQEARIALASGIGLSIIDIWVTYSVGLLQQITQFRAGDSSIFKNPTLKGDVSWTSTPLTTHGVTNTFQYRNMAGTVVTLKEDPILGPITTYEVIDLTASFNAAKNAGSPLSRSQKKALLAKFEVYGKGPPADFAGTPEELDDLRKAKNHRDIIDTLKIPENLHQAPIATGDAGAGCGGCCVAM